MLYIYSKITRIPNYSNRIMRLKYLYYHKFKKKTLPKTIANDIVMK